MRPRDHILMATEQDTSGGTYVSGNVNGGGDARQRAQLRRQRVVIGVISALLVAAVIASVLALDASREAQAQGQVARSLVLDAQARQASAEHQPHYRSSVGFRIEFR